MSGDFTSGEFGIIKEKAALEGCPKKLRSSLAKRCLFLLHDWICKNFHWERRSTFALAAMGITMTVLLAGGITETVVYNSHALTTKACKGAFSLSCEYRGRDASIGFYLLFLCCILGTFQIGQMAKPGSKFWKSSSTWIETYLSAKVLRFSLSLSLLGVNVMIYSTFGAFGSMGKSFGVGTIFQLLIYLALLATFVFFDLEIIANWNQLKGKFGNVIPGLLVGGLTYAFIVARAWADWHWASVVIAFGVAAGLTTVWRWILRAD